MTSLTGLTGLPSRTRGQDRGEPLMAMAARRCPQCGAPNDELRHFCAACGEPLRQPTEDQDIGATRPFVPTAAPAADDDAQRTEAFQPTPAPPRWSDAEQVDTPAWTSSPARDALGPTTMLRPQRAIAEPSGRGVVLGCIALFLIGVITAAVLWLTYVGPSIPNALSP